MRDSTLCFVCAHLAAHRDNVDARNADVKHIVEKARCLFVYRYYIFTRILLLLTRTHLHGHDVLSRWRFTTKRGEAPKARRRVRRRAARRRASAAEARARRRRVPRLPSQPPPVAVAVAVAGPVAVPLLARTRTALRCGACGRSQMPAGPSTQRACVVRHASCWLRRPCYTHSLPQHSRHAYIHSSGETCSFYLSISFFLSISLSLCVCTCVCARACVCLCVR